MFRKSKSPLPFDNMPVTTEESVDFRSATDADCYLSECNKRV